jgi:hypothetical protein
MERVPKGVAMSGLRPPPHGHPLPSLAREGVSSWNPKRGNQSALAGAAMGAFWQFCETSIILRASSNIRQFDLSVARDERSSSRCSHQPFWPCPCSSYSPLKLKDEDCFTALLKQIASGVTRVAVLRDPEPLRVCRRPQLLRR